jgi:hypothetical protein
MPTEELLQWLGDVKVGTNDGRIKWKVSNPTTYLWEARASRPARVVLQRIDRAVPVQTEKGVIQESSPAYILQVFDLASPGAAPVVFNGSIEREVNSLLKDLFENVVHVSQRQEIDFLNSILPKP